MTDWNYGYEDATALRVTRTSYSDHAETYRMQTRQFSRYRGLDNEIRNFVAHLNPGLIADIGSGSGRDSLFMADLGYRVVALDSCYPLLRMLRSSGVQTGLLCGDVMALPIRDNVFSGAIVSGVLLHLPRRLCLPALSEIRRVLGVGGRVLISMKRGTDEGWRTTDDFPLPRWFTYYDPDEFSKLCINAGLLPREMLISGRKDWFTILATPELNAESHHMLDYFEFAKRRHQGGSGN